MSLLNGEPKISNPSLFKRNTDINPDFRKYKSNNSQAFRAMYELVVFDGNMNNPKFNPNVKKIIEDSMFYSVENGEVLGRKLKQFQAAWAQIKKNPRLRAGVSNTLSAFHFSWPEYSDAIGIYNDRESFPVYFDVAQYLTDLLDNNGNINPGALDKQDSYADLAREWRAEINAQYEDYIEHKRKPDEQS